MAKFDVQRCRLVRSRQFTSSSRSERAPPVAPSSRLGGGTDLWEKRQPFAAGWGGESIVVSPSSDSLRRSRHPLASIRRFPPRPQLSYRRGKKTLDARRPPRDNALLFPRMWRNWQTRRLQVPVALRPCRFDSYHPHSCDGHPRFGRLCLARRVRHIYSAFVLAPCPTPVHPGPVTPHPIGP